MDDSSIRPAPSDRHPELGNTLALWLFSRLLIAGIFWVVSSKAAPGTSVWDLFTQWDGAFYREIVTQGYRYSRDFTAGVSVAFFPLFPLLSWGLMQLGIPFELGGPLINNLAFLGAIVVLHGWMRDRYSFKVAQWVTAVLILCPYSLFGTVAYTEGLFLLLTTAALQAYEQQSYRSMAVWGALATATRPTGVVLIPAFLLAAWKDRRSPVAYLAALGSAIGILSYSLFCWLRFGNPLAFLHAQYAWRPSSGFAWPGWLKMLTQIFLGTVEGGVLKTPWHPIALIGIAIAAALLWRTRDRWSSVIVDYGCCLLVVLVWAVIGDPLLNFAAVFGVGWLLWRSRTELSTIVLTYGFCALGLILLSGSTISLGRISYGVVSGAIGLGLVLSKHPRWGYASLGFFALLLLSFGDRFAHGFWAG
ncbi:MAG TPA: mannosyltransferase family protein [Thermosynechococcaceae cyanobacterium]